MGGLLFFVFWFVFVLFLFVFFGGCWMGYGFDWMSKLNICVWMVYMAMDVPCCCGGGEK